MANGVLEDNGSVQYGIKSYFCDNKADINNLPTNCKPGSTAIVIEDGSVYMLNSAREWKEI